MFGRMMTLNNDGRPVVFVLDLVYHDRHDLAYIFRNDWLLLSVLDKNKSAFIICLEIQYGS